MRFAAFIFAVVLLILGGVIVSETVAHAQTTTVMTLDHYRTAVKTRQFAWTNRAQANRCRTRIRFADFTKTPMTSVSPGYREERVAQARAKHHRAQERESRCFLDVVRREYQAIPSWRRDVFEDVLHPCEGSWSDADDPFWGGLQMDHDFMESYGHDALRYYGGLANVWAPFVQVVVADRAYRAGRGFHPWPWCASHNGLI